MSFLSKLIQRINQREINKYSDKISILSNTCPLKTHFIKTPKRLKFINFLARLRLVQRFIILLLSACIGCAIYNAYLVLEQNDSVDIRTTLPAIQLPSVGQKKPFPIEEYHETSISNTIDDDQAMSSSKSFLTLLESKYFSTPLEPSLNEMESKLLFTNENKMPKILPNHHWTNLFSLYNISLIGQFISILPPILISIPVKPESIEKIRNPSDSDYNLLKKFIPTKFVDGEYKLFDEEDSEEFDRMKKSSVISDNFNIIIGLWMPSFILFVYLIVQLYQCFCTRNYAEWRSGLTSNNLLNQFRSWMKTAQLRNINHEKLFTINISMLNYDKEKLSYSSEKEFSLDNQEIDLIAATVETSLIATVSMSGDIRVYDSLTFECLGSIKRSKAKGQFSFFKAFTYEDETKSDKPNSPIVVKSEDNLLRKWFLSLENDSNHEKNTFLQEDFNEDTEKIDFRPIWSIDLFDRFVLIGCGGDDGRLEVYDAYTGRLVFVYTPETPNKTSLGITAIKSTLWGVVLARLNGQLEILELMDQYKPKNYNSIHSMSDSKTILYTSKSLIQAHKQPLSSIEIIDFTNEDEFLKIFGIRGCLITGSLDTTLKVFALENLKLIFTLRGHYGPINTAVIDSVRCKFSAATALSGCQLGQLCVWDISTGTCLFSIQAHQEAEIISITTSSLYYATAGTNNKICIWDRFSGNSIHKIDFQYNFCRNMIFLSSYILMTARKNDLVIWDINDARIICLVPLSNQENSNRSIEKNSELSILNQSVLIRNLMFTYQQKAIVCDYGYSVCIVDNPFVTKKSD
ncbi:hypothetical protein QR98_0096240 [Sarcoptes scabiei]|uniref:Uncharacterized protein n=1 Tax=Sarcoptes scabiei TaxID=52283 RepID=A0A132AJ67_SARSC|nr:hypothetical protein QR98_0096240 [Sarcoptes scabiei]